jgi:hypothetical protein
MQAELIRTQNLAALGEMAATVATRSRIRSPRSAPLQILADDLKPTIPTRA